MVVDDTNRNDLEKDVAQNSRYGIKPQRLSRGYRTSSPPLQSPVYFSDSLALGEDIDMKEDLDDPFHYEEPGGHLGEDTEANMSDGASSGNSSYGDMGIDVAELEEICKVYDA